jgi:hypothetical protein
MVHSVRLLATLCSQSSAQESHINESWSSWFIMPPFVAGFHAMIYELLRCEDLYGIYCTEKMFQGFRHSLSLATRQWLAALAWSLSTILCDVAYRYGYWSKSVGTHRRTRDDSTSHRGLYGCVLLIIILLCSNTSSLYTTLISWMMWIFWLILLCLLIDTKSSRPYCNQNVSLLRCQRVIELEWMPICIWDWVVHYKSEPVNTIWIWLCRHVNHHPT